MMDKDILDVRSLAVTAPNQAVVACPGAQRLSHLVRNTANSPPSISAILSDWRSRVRGVY